MQPSPNYYAPPQPPAPGNDPYYRQNVFVPPGASSSPLPAPGLKKATLGAGIAQLVTMFGGLGLIVVGAVMSGNRHDETANAVAGVGMGLFGLWYLVIIAYGILNMVWLYKMWAWIPPEQRHTKMWKKYISPGTAVGFMFIPYFNIYWMFVLYLGMADVFERMSVQYPTTQQSPRTSALIALIVPFVFFPAAPIVQYMFAKHVETIAREMQGKMGRPIA